MLIHTRVIAALTILSLSWPAWGLTPVLYHQPAYQSPVSAEPDDLLLLPGDGLAASDTVFYSAASDDGRASDEASVAPIVSTDNVPYSLTIRLPQTMTAARPYSLRVRNAAGEWSNEILINDARPLWITPALVYSTGKIAGLPRVLQIVGRNLLALSGEVVRVRLDGPHKIDLQASSDTAASARRGYVAAVELPPRIEPGDYSVAISRDDRHWIRVPDATLHVRSDPPAPRVLRIDDPQYGGCRASDGHDDAGCLQRALDAARTTPAATIELGAGDWDLASDTSMVIPRGVALRGVSTDARLIRHAGRASSRAVFVLLGTNEVTGLTFVDTQRYESKDRPAPMLQLGAGSGAGDSVDDVIITDNVFDKPGFAIVDSGLPLRRLFIARNRIGAFHKGLRLGGNRFEVGQRFLIEDAVIVHNRFLPGSYLDVPARQGAIASELGASRRVDFSYNEADGAATQALYSSSDAAGWRAAFFWHMNDSHELLLVSENVATCTGDKAGDGEAIAYDNNANTFAFDAARTVRSATARTLTVAGPLRARQNQRPIDAASYYRGHWLRVLDGPGIGQVRRIETYEIDAATGAVTFHVAPAWDVTPRGGASRISVGREFWQVYTLDNRVDHRRPLCRKSNRSQPRAGSIALWGQMSDSVVAGNRQYDTDGIVMHQAYRPATRACADCAGWLNAKSFIDVRSNLIDGEYDWGSDCSWSGIQLQYAAAPEEAPPVITYGVVIAHNEVTRADGLRGGGISMPRTWHAGPAPHRWSLIDSTLIHHNRLRNIRGAPARGGCAGPPVPRAGIDLTDAQLAWHTILYRNSCVDTPLGYRRGAHQTRTVCENSAADSCECSKDAE